MKVIFFTKYTRLGASSRLRTFLYLSFFEQQGIECVVTPFFTEDYLLEVYKYKRHNKWLSIQSFLRRLSVLFVVGRYDFVVIEKELFPYFPSFFEWLLYKLGVRYLVDYDDAVFHNYDVSPNILIRTFLKHKIGNVMRYSSIVTAGNQYIADKARNSGAKNIAIIPTVIDTEKYKVKIYKESNIFTIGWIGSPITHKYLAALKPVFQKLVAKYKITLKLIGARKGIGMPEIEHVIPWSEAEEALEIQYFNVGIMPLEDNIWERGKCGYKLLQYMGCGVPVIGTPIGVNDEIIINGWNGFKATTIEDWYNSLEYLIKGGVENEKRMGMNGREYVETHYSLQVYRKKYAEIILNQ